MSRDRKKDAPYWTEDCWIFTGSRNSKGYGQLKRGGSWKKAHRVVYEALIAAPIPTGMVLDHLCENPSCVNPKHLEPVSNQENVRRGMEKFKSMSDVCKNGHPKDEANVVFLKGKNRLGEATQSRNCRSCMREARRRWRARNKKVA